MEPRTLAERIENQAGIPDGLEERFSGYGVIGQPFRTGHVLALRRFPSSSIGPGYTSIWHRTPDGAWTFYADADPMMACTRYFGSGVDEAVQCDIGLEWEGPYTLHVTMNGGRLYWKVDLHPSRITQAMSAMGQRMPERLWHSRPILRAMGMAAGPALRAGRMALEGTVPNGQHFAMAPKLLWEVANSEAMLDGVELGEPGPLPRQARLGDMCIPQRGIFAVGQAFFDPLDEQRHRAVPSRSAGSSAAGMATPRSSG